MNKIVKCLFICHKRLSWSLRVFCFFCLFKHPTFWYLPTGHFLPCVFDTCSFWKLQLLYPNVGSGELFLGIGHGLKSSIPDLALSSVAFDFFPHNYNLDCWEVAEYRCQLLLYFSWPCLCFLLWGQFWSSKRSTPCEPSEEGNREKKGMCICLLTERWRVVLLPCPGENKTGFSSSWDNSSMPLVSLEAYFFADEIDVCSISCAFHLFLKVRTFTCHWIC